MRLTSAGSAPSTFTPTGVRTPGREHIDAPANRHRPCVGDPWDRERFVHLRNELLLRYVIGRDVSQHGLQPLRGPTRVPRRNTAPLGLGLERDRWSRASKAAPDPWRYPPGPPCRERSSTSGNCRITRSVICNSRCASVDRDAGHRGRHVQERTLVQRRHELRPQPHGRREWCTAPAPLPPPITRRRCRNDHRHYGFVGPHENSRMGCFVLRRICPTNSAFAVFASHRGRKSKLRSCVSGSRSAGSSVIARTAATTIASVFVYASGLNNRPSCASSASTGRNETRDHQQREEAGPRHLLYCRDHHVAVLASPSARFPFLQLLVCLLHHHDRGIHQGADGDCDTAKRHDVRGHAHLSKRNERDQHRRRES